MKERLPLSFKLAAKRTFFRLSRPFTKIFPGSRFTQRINASAQAHGLSSSASPTNDKSLPEILVFDQVIPMPDRDAGSARMMFILRALAEWSHPVFIPLAKRLLPEYEKQLWNCGIETASILNYKHLLIQRNFKAVILSRPDVADLLLKSIRRIKPELKIVFDPVDVHHVRFQREADLTGSASAAQKAETFRRIETQVTRAADLIWCVSLADQEIVEQLAPNVPTTVIPTIHELHDRGLPFAARHHLLFVGNFSHRPNVDAIHFMVREVLPLIRRALSEIELHAAGLNAPPEFDNYSSAGLKVLGFVPDLGAAMSTARVFVAPIRFGAGINGKIGEALGYGLPVVTTTLGAKGWGLTNNEQILVADSPADFADAVVRLYNDKALWQKLSDAGYRHIKEHNTPEVICRISNDSIKSLIGVK